MSLLTNLKIKPLLGLDGHRDHINKCNNLVCLMPSVCVQSQSQESVPILTEEWLLDSKECLKKDSDIVHSLTKSLSHRNAFTHSYHKEIFLSKCTVEVSKQ